MYFFSRLKNIRKEGARKDREGDEGGDSGDDDDQFNIIPGNFIDSSFYLNNFLLSLWEEASL